MTPQPPPNLNETNPLEDLWALFRSPHSFFRYFAEATTIPFWVVAKGVLGLSFFVWLSSFGRRVLPVRELSLWMTHQLREFSYGQLLLSNGLGDRLVLATEALSRLLFVLAPIFVLISVAMTAASAYAFLPFVGVSPERRSFRRIFLAGIFAQWWAVLGLIPGIGPSLATLFQVVAFTVAVSSMHEIGWFRSFAVLYLMGWLMLGLVVMASVLGFYWFFA